MDPYKGVAGMPGIGTEVVQESRIFLKDPNHVVVRNGIIIDADAVDTDHTGKTHVLRPGLMLVRIEEGAKAGKYTDLDNDDAPEYDADIVDCVILRDYCDMRAKDVGGATAYEDKQAAGVIHGAVDDDQILYGGADAGRIAAAQATFTMGVAFLTSVS